MDNTSGSVMEVQIVLLSVVIGATVLVLMYIIKLIKSQKAEDQSAQIHPLPPQPNLVAPAANVKAVPSGKKRAEGNAAPRWRSSEKTAFTHPWMLTALKGHSGHITDMDFSSNGKFLATSAEDRTVLIWCTRDLSSREHKSIRINIEYDHPSFVCWSPDCRAFIIQRATDNCIEVYKVDKKKDGWIATITKAHTFPKTHNLDTIALGISCNGNFIMSCTSGTDFSLYNLKGQLLTTVDTCLMSNSCARISPCGRFIAASGFAPDVKVWEVIFAKTGEFQKMSRAFELSGHSSGVYDVAFDADSSRIATVSKDGTWKVFNTKIEYTRGEDPRLKITGRYNQCSTPAKIAMSPDGEVVAIATGCNLAFYLVDTGELDKNIENVYSGPISCLTFDAAGKYLLTSGDKHIRVFHNVTGYRASIIDSKEKLRLNQTSATKERLEMLIKNSQKFLKNIGETNY